jgi:hypothetical protein
LKTFENSENAISDKTLALSEQPWPFSEQPWTFSEETLPFSENPNHMDLLGFAWICLD